MLGSGAFFRSRNSDINTDAQTETQIFKQKHRKSDRNTETQTKADLLDLCFGAFLSRVWLLVRLEDSRGVIQAGHGALHPPLLNHRLQLTDALLVVTHLHKPFVKSSKI